MCVLVANIRLIWYFPSAYLHVGCVLLIHGVDKSVISLVQCVYLVANIRLHGIFHQHVCMLAVFY